MAAAKMTHKFTLEAARAASLAVHSAAGLSLATSRDAARLLRAAEGLCRAAVAVLASEPKTHTDEPSARQPRRRRPRGKRVDAQGKMDMDVSTAAEEENTIGGNTCSAGGENAMDGVTATAATKRKAESSEPPGDAAKTTEFARMSPEELFEALLARRGLEGMRPFSRGGVPQGRAQATVTPVLAAPR